MPSSASHLRIISDFAEEKAKMQPAVSEVPDEFDCEVAINQIKGRQRDIRLDLDNLSRTQARKTRDLSARVCEVVEVVEGLKHTVAIIKKEAVLIDERMQDEEHDGKIRDGQIGLLQSVSENVVAQTDRQEKEIRQLKQNRFTLTHVLLIGLLVSVIGNSAIYVIGGNALSDRLFAIEEVMRRP